MSGKVVDALTGDSVFNAYLLFFDAAADTARIDSLVFNGKQLSIARTDSSGVFLATNLKPMRYKVYALKDENGNQFYDPGEDKIALINESFNPAEMEPFKAWIDPVRKRLRTAPQFELRMFKEGKRQVPQRLLDTKRPNKYELDANFANEGVEIVDISIDSVPGKYIWTERNPTGDSIKFWAGAWDYRLPDTLKGTITYLALDSLGNPMPVTKKFEHIYIDPADRKTTGEKIAAAVSDGFKKFIEKIANWFRNWGMKRKIRKGMIADPNAKKIAADSLGRDSLALDSLALDSLAVKKLPGKAKSPADTVSKLTFRFNPSGDINPTKRLMFETRYPLYWADTAQLTFTRIQEVERTEDSFSIDDVEVSKKRDSIRTSYPVKLVRDTLSLRRVYVDIPLEENSKYEFYMPKGKVMDISGELNDSTKYSFKTYNPSEFGRFSVALKGTEGNYVVELLDSMDVMKDFRAVRAGDSVTFSFVTPKKHKIRIIEDLNGNGKWDPGVLLERKEPERTRIFRDPAGKMLYEVKARGNVNLEIDPAALFRGEAAGGQTGTVADTLGMVFPEPDSLGRVLPDSLAGAILRPEREPDSLAAELPDGNDKSEGQ